MTYSELFDKMQNCKLIASNWSSMLQFIDGIIPACPDKDVWMKVFTLYFSYLDEGNVYMPLVAADLKSEFVKKLNGAKIQAEEEDDNDILKSLDDVLAEIKSVCPAAASAASAPIVSADGKDNLFVVDQGGRLYSRKNYNAVCRINDSINRLFKNNPPITGVLDPKKALAPGKSLSAGQIEVLEKGIYNNLLVTGGPGTGKTTSILFLLMALRLSGSNGNIYLTAPSGKASARMKDSILGSEDIIDPVFASTNAAIIDSIKSVKSSTIHKLLGYDPNNSCFVFNAKNQFPADSIFIIDEASMIDVSIFADLLDAIPSEARVFILGDKNQLPSVECGAVFGGLLDNAALINNIVYLKDSQRFSSSSEIFELSEKINNNDDISYIKEKALWKNWSDFELEFPADPNGKDTPIHYYLDADPAGKLKDADMSESIAKKWFEAFYKDLQGKCTDIDFAGPVIENRGGIDFETYPDFDEIWNIAENARILCARNRSPRGINHINSFILKEYFSSSKKISGFYPGELLIIVKNNKALDLFNGDCGVTVKFKGDDTLYLMLKQGTTLNIDNDKVENKIFKLGDYLFYPIRMISSEDIASAFAITIHKSQGSDYKNILVILPRTKGHPLLNRQIIYTAITRTKRSTYIISNQTNLEAAKETKIERKTF